MDTDMLILLILTLVELAFWSGVLAYFIVKYTKPGKQ